MWKISRESQKLQISAQLEFLHQEELKSPADIWLWLFSSLSVGSGLQVRRHLKKTRLWRPCCASLSTQRLRKWHTNTNPRVCIRARGCEYVFLCRYIFELRALPHSKCLAPRRGYHVRANEFFSALVALGTSLVKKQTCFYDLKWQKVVKFFIFCFFLGWTQAQAVF